MSYIMLPAVLLISKYIDCVLLTFKIYIPFVFDFLLGHIQGNSGWRHSSSGMHTTVRETMY